LIRYQNFHLRDEEDQLINGVMLKQSLVDQVQTTAFSIVPNNFAQAFAIPNIISVIVIAFVFGAAIVSLQKKPRAAGGVSTVLSLCKDMSEVSNEIIGWIITLAPVCIGFLIATSIASAGHIIDLLRTVGVYVLSVNVGLLVHTCVMLPAVFYWYTGGENPYSWLYAIRQPLLVAFSTSSSVSIRYDVIRYNAICYMLKCVTTGDW
jgi:Na+/H+-dicarboxylate symporter